MRDFGDPVELRLERRSIPEPNTGCWLWTGVLFKTGYPRLSQGRDGESAAHRIAFTRHKGPIPDGMTVDHICRMRCCVNHEHMELVTGPVNTTRRAARAMLCGNGHELSWENVSRRTDHGGVICLRCHSERQLRYTARKRAAA